MKLITRKLDDVIVLSSSLANITDNGIEVEKNSFIQPTQDYNIFEVSDDFQFLANKQCFDGIHLTDNPNYVEPPLSNEEKLMQLEQKQTLMQKALDDLLLGGMM
ncbi:hypothetical protein [Mangrovibacillus cuniculi]|uniref:Uncharacterized protein n=1 Tax=Mangrovibacillus cuniculi TaxID=2593652 RepID=A0A7S8CBU6_9BACI|nr:hypothetical protein [Mangrovibacillus cuniculi]QPC47103.1 hypothetical protein G8O30_09055 [Mangrovibacillus cuniculi]